MWNVLGNNNGGWVCANGSNRQFMSRKIAFERQRTESWTMLLCTCFFHIHRFKTFLSQLCVPFFLCSTCQRPLLHKVLFLRKCFHTLLLLPCRFFCFFFAAKSLYVNVTRDSFHDWRTIRSNLLWMKTMNRFLWFRKKNIPTFEPLPFPPTEFAMQSIDTSWHGNEMRAINQTDSESMYSRRQDKIDEAQ